MFKSLRKTNLAVGLAIALGVLPLAACSEGNTNQIAPLGKQNICVISSNQNITPVPSIIELSLKGMVDSKAAKTGAEKAKKPSQQESPTLDGISEKQLVFLQYPEGGAKIRNLIRDKNCGLVFVTDPTLVAAAEEFSYKISKRDGVVPQFVAVVPDLEEKKAYPFNVLKVNLQEPAFIAGFTAAALTRSGATGALYTNPEQKPRTQAFVKGVKYYNLFKGSGIKSNIQEINYNEIRMEYESLVEAKVDMFFYPGVINSQWGFTGDKNQAKLISIAPNGTATMAKNKLLLAAKKPGGVYDGSGSLIRLTVNPEKYLAEMIKLAQEGKPITNVAQLSPVDGSTDYMIDPNIATQLPDSLKRQLEAIKKQFVSGKLKLSDL